MHMPSGHLQRTENGYFNDPIVEIFVCSTAAFNTIIRYIRSPHTCTLVSYLLKEQAVHRILRRILRPRSFCPGRHLRRESRPCVVIKHQKDKDINSNTHTRIQKAKIQQDTRDETLSVRESQKISFLPLPFLAYIKGCFYEGQNKVCSFAHAQAGRP